MIKSIVFFSYAPLDINFGKESSNKSETIVILSLISHKYMFNKGCWYNSVS